MGWESYGWDGRHTQVGCDYGWVETSNWGTIQIGVIGLVETYGLLYGLGGDTGQQHIDRHLKIATRGRSVDEFQSISKLRYSPCCAMCQLPTASGVTFHISTLIFL